jgi:uncharacterized protein (TIGR02270 family)
VERAIGFSPSEISALVNTDVVQRHARNAAFLWFLRDRACIAPNYSLKDLAALDERVDANLEGIETAGLAGWEAVTALDLEDPGAVFAAAILALSTGDNARSEMVMDIARTAPECDRPLVSALGWLPFEKVNEPIHDALCSSDPNLRTIGLAATGVRRQDPGPALKEALFSTDPALSARAFRTAGELGKVEFASLMLTHLADSDLHCRFWSAWSAARLGMRISDVCKTLYQIALTSGPYAPSALAIALLCADRQTSDVWVSNLINGPAAHIRLGIVGVGVLGDPVRIDNLIQLMENHRLARAAGEAFSQITGVDLSYADLKCDPPEGAKEEVSDDADDPNLAEDLDADLPWPDPVLVTKWWNSRRQNFRAGARYLRGEEITPVSLNKCLLTGTQRQRAAAALELAILSPRGPMFEVRARGKTQMELLRSWTS